MCHALARRAAVVVAAALAASLAFAAPALAGSNTSAPARVPGAAAEVGVTTDVDLPALVPPPVRVTTVRVPVIRLPLVVPTAGQSDSDGSVSVHIG